MKHDYREGSEALERFEKTMTTLFRAKKTTTKQPKKPIAKRKKASKG